VSWTDPYLDGIGGLCRWIEAQTGCRPVCTVQFVVGAAHLSWPDWHVYNGHLGHMHVPFNDHSDPGAMNIARILVAGPHSPPATPFPEDQMRRIDVHVDNLDGKGNGWVRLANIDAAKVVSVVAHGAYPPVDGYWNLPTFGRQQRGADTIIQISEANANTPVHLSVWIADRHEPLVRGPRVTSMVSEG
jgi:hypothetical protein